MKRYPVGLMEKTQKKKYNHIRQQYQLWQNMSAYVAVAPLTGIRVMLRLHLGQDIGFSD
jgi:hypothetical protein